MTKNSRGRAAGRRRRRAAEESEAAEAAAAAAAASARAAEVRAVLGGELHAVLRPLLQMTFPTLSDAEDNEHARLGSALSHQFFSHGVTSISDLTLVVHGSPLANHERISREGLLLSWAVSTPGALWCTTDIETARQYTRGTTDRLHVFVAHRRLLEDRLEGRVFTFNQPHALMPVYRTRMPSPSECTPDWYL
jgi:hypothetical protein